MLGRRLISAVVLVLFLLMPATAWGAEEDEGAIATFQVKASNGYRVLVLASRQPGKARGDIAIIVGSREGSVIYATKAAVEAGGIRADLGELGRIDLVYLPLKGKEKHSCGPGSDVDRVPRGEYRGIFELYGEEGYTEAQATRVAAEFGILYDLVCGGGVSFSDSTGPGLPGARLNVDWHGPDGTISFEIKKNRPSAPTAFAVTTRERRGELRIERAIEATVGAGAFRYDRNLRVATVSPSAPFDGSATFRRELPRGARWTGDLTIDLPGRSDTPLVQPGSRLSLVHAGWSKSREGSFRPQPFGHPLALLESPEGVR